MMNDEMAALRNSVFLCSVFIIPKPDGPLFCTSPNRAADPGCSNHPPGEFWLLLASKVRGKDLIRLQNRAFIEAFLVPFVLM
jgi:hypothetical protein